MPQSQPDNVTHQSKPVVVITGGSGLIGTHVLNELGHEYDLVVLDRYPPSTMEDTVHFISTDFTEDDSLAQACRQVREEHGSQVASVVHLVAYYDFSGEPSPLYDKLTVEGTRKFLEQLKAAGLQVKQFVFSSSLLAMKPQEGKLTEESDTQAEWAYPQSKLEAEQVIRDERGDSSIVLLRIAGVYDEKCHSLPLSQQITRIYEKQLESWVFPGNPKHGQTLIHLDDLARCIKRVIEKRDELDEEEVFLIGEPDLLSYGELQERIGELVHGSEWTTIRIPKAVAKVGAWAKDQFAADDDKPFIKPWMVDLADANYDVSIETARRKLGWEPKHKLADDLPKMIDFLKNDPESFYETNTLGAS